MTPYESLLVRTSPALYRDVLRYVNAVRAVQGLAPLSFLRIPSYTLAPAQRVHCPFWLSCIDAPVVTPGHIAWLRATLADFGFIAVTPPWLTDWIRQHDALWRTYLQETLA